MQSVSQVLLKSNKENPTADVENSKGGINLWPTIFFIIVAGIMGTIFKYLAGLIDFVSMVAFGLSNEKLEENMITKPRRFFTVLVIKSTLIGLLNAYVILYTDNFFILNTNIHNWILITLSIIWSLFILQYSGLTPWIYFFTSTVSLVCVFLGFGLSSLLIIGILSIIISLPYHYGRINTLVEEIRQSDNESNISI